MSLRAPTEAAKGCGTNEALNKKVLTVWDICAKSAPMDWPKSLKWPDGGVVTQRTANPLPRADFSQSSQFGPPWSLAGFRVAFVPTANRGSPA